MMKHLRTLLTLFAISLLVSYSIAQLSWTQLLDVPVDRQMCGIAATQEYPYYLYLIGGNVASALPGETVDTNMDSLGILKATINPADGTITSWELLPQQLPNEDGGFCNFVYIENACFCYKGYLYIVGGNTNSAEANRTVVTYAKINADGTLGSWQTASFSPPGNGESENVCFAYNDRIYIIGGRDNSATNQPYCYYAPIGADGAPGTFVRDTDSDLPQGMWFHRGVVLDGYVYIIGGFTSAAQNTVYSAPINPDGSLGTWTTQATLPAARHDGAAWTLGGKIYYAGGTGYSTVVYVATPSSPGVITSWSTDTPLPNPRRRGGAVNIGNNVYLAGWRESVGVLGRYVYGVVGPLAAPTPTPTPEPTPTPLAVSPDWTIYQ